jgi:hypothetical protein
LSNSKSGTAVYENGKLYDEVSVIHQKSGSSMDFQIEFRIDLIYCSTSESCIRTGSSESRERWLANDYEGTQNPA